MTEEQLRAIPYLTNPDWPKYFESAQLIPMSDTTAAATFLAGQAALIQAWMDGKGFEFAGDPVLREALDSEGRLLGQYFEITGTHKQFRWPVWLTGYLGERIHHQGEGRAVVSYGWDFLWDNWEKHLQHAKLTGRPPRFRSRGSASCTHHIGFDLQSRSDVTAQALRELHGRLGTSPTTPKLTDRHHLTESLASMVNALTEDR